MPTLEPSRVRRYAGWSAYLSAGISILSAVFLSLFYALEAPRSIATGGAAPAVFGTINDIATLFEFLFLLPVALALHQLTSSRERGPSRVGLALGVVGILIVVIAQALLVARVISFAVNLPFVLAGFALIGGWMTVANHLGRVGGALPPRLAWLGTFTGAAILLLGGLVLLLVLVAARDPVAAASTFGAFAQQYPALIVVVIVLLAPLALLAYFVGLVIWPLGVGRHLLAGASTPGQSGR